MSDKKTVYYAGGNERRASCLAQIPDVEVRSVGGGKESETACVLAIALDKLAYAFPLIMQSGDNLNGAVVVSADARTEIKQLSNEGEVVHISKGKPKDASEVFDNFQKMAQVNSPGYRLRVASAAKSSMGIQPEQNACLVNLSPQGAKYLATTAGFDEYEQAYQDFYSTAPYSSHGLKTIGLSGISSGISLPVLLSMKVIAGLGVDRELKTDLNEETLKLAIYTVAVGFGPQVLKEIHPDALEAIMEWSWLNQVVKKV